MDLFSYHDWMLLRSLLLAGIAGAYVVVAVTVGAFRAWRESPSHPIAGFTPRAASH